MKLEPAEIRTSGHRLCCMGNNILNYEKDIALISLITIYCVITDNKNNK